MKEQNPVDARFRVVGMWPEAQLPSPARRNAHRKWPAASLAVLAALVLGCLFCEAFLPHDPHQMDLMHCSEPPGAMFWFGTDTLGRDVFSMVWYGGRISLAVGLGATALSTAIAILVGTLSGCAPAWLDALMLRAMDLLLSVPGLLLTVLLQALLGEASAWSLMAVIGVTSWTSVARVVRTEVRALRTSEFVLAARLNGGGFWHVLWRHLAPNFLPAILFMVVMNVRGAIVAESTLSFLGIGLPVEVVSWGSLLSLSEQALLRGSWWMILIPGAFLTASVLCLTNLGNALRVSLSARHSNL